MAPTAEIDTQSFSLGYHAGETGPKLTRSEFGSIAEAAAYATERGIPATRLAVTEWEPQALDAAGVPEYIGSCSLDEAIEGGYTSLEFI